MKTPLIKKIKSATIQIVLIVAVLVSVTWWQTRDMLATDGSVIVPTHSLVNLHGEVVPLAEKGKRTLVYFFAPWCSICRFSIGNLDYVANQELNIVRVALSYDSVEAVEKFVNENGVSGQVLLGTLELQRAFKVKGFPSYYLLDENQQVVAKSYGYSTAAGLNLIDWLNKGAS